MRTFNIFAIASLAYAANCRVLEATTEGEAFIVVNIEGGDADLETLTSSDLGDVVPGLADLLEGINVKELPMGEDALREDTAGEAIIAAEIDGPDHDDASCLKETTYRGLPEQPACPSGFDQIALSCLQHCDSGYDQFGAMCEQRCPSGFRDNGAFCAKTQFEWSGPWYARRMVFTQDCPDGMQDWGIVCKKDEYARQTTSPSCSSSQDSELGLCYNKCNDGFYGIGGVCWGDCPAGTQQCGVICLGPTEDCTERIIDITEGAMRMAALAAAAPTGIGAVLAIKEIYEFAEDVDYPICNA